MDYLLGIESTTSGLDAQRQRLDAIFQNIANANTTRTPGGGPYQRQTVSFESLLNEKGGSKVAVESVSRDTSPGEVRYEPDHPHADENGNVEMPNVSMSREMVDMLSASRAYEANLAAMRTGRQMAQKTLEIGR
ncbi:MAG: flagellar basal body rod protein FlgC [Opitutales bacterium]